MLFLFLTLILSQNWDVVKSPKEYPYNLISYVVSFFDDGSTQRGSGFFINNNVLVTNAHILIRKGSIADSVKVIINKRHNNQDTTIYSNKISLNANYLHNKRGFDIGAVFFENIQISKKFPKILNTDIIDSDTVIVSGYPGTHQTQMMRKDIIKSVSKNDRFFSKKTTGLGDGSSGCPVIKFINNEPYYVGINSYKTNVNFGGYVFFGEIVSMMDEWSYNYGNYNVPPILSGFNETKIKHNKFTHKVKFKFNKKIMWGVVKQTILNNEFYISNNKQYINVNNMLGDTLNVVVYDHFLNKETFNVVFGNENKKPSFNDNIIDDNIVVYPNPTNGDINIKISTNETTETTVKIYGLNGRLVGVINKRIGMGNNYLHYSLQNLSNGLYIIQTRVGSKLYSKKITKIRN